MEVSIHLPDDLVQRIQDQWEDVPSHVLESFALEGFRVCVDYGRCSTVARV